MISPTGLGIRGIDVWGSGAYGAGRGKRIHKGADYVCIPGQSIVAPINGVIIRQRLPYADRVERILFGGVLIRGAHCDITLFYLQLDVKLITMRVDIGQKIGVAQDISLKYPGIIPHIHMQIDSINPELLINLP